MPAKPSVPALTSLTTCGEQACMSKEDVTALAGYIHLVHERDLAIARCSLIEVAP